MSSTTANPMSVFRSTHITSGQNMHLEPATPSEAAHLADILFRGFANDRLITGLCYPDTPANREWWARAIASQMNDPNTKVFKVVVDDDEAGRVVAWAKWLIHRPPPPGEPASLEKHGAVNPDEAPSKDMNIDACRKLAAAQYAMRHRVLGERGHWCEFESCHTQAGTIWLMVLTERVGLNAIVTEPDYQRRGAASLLVAEGCKLADEHGLDVFSACTMQANENMRRVWARYSIEIVDSEAVDGELSVFAGLRRGKIPQ